MQHPFALLGEGQVDEWTATVLVRETAILSLEDRKRLDERLRAMTVDAATGEVSEPLVLGWTPRGVAHAARALAAELDPEAAVRRNAKAEADRKVTIRPAPDTMTYVTGLVPVEQGVAVWASLKAGDKAEKAAGDDHTEAQLMADLFVQRLTGQVTANAVSAEIHLVMTPPIHSSGTSDRPARIGDCVVPAQTARDLVRRTDVPRWLRRVFTDPVTGVATAADPRRRRFTAEDARFVDIRPVVSPSPLRRRHRRPRPCLPRRRRRRDHPHQRAGALRGTQPGQGDAGLDHPSDGSPTRAALRRDPHAHRAHLPVQRTARPAAAGVTGLRTRTVAVILLPWGCGGSAYRSSWASRSGWWRPGRRTSLRWREASRAEPADRGSFR